MEKWAVNVKKADFFAIGEKYNIDPVIARLIRNRDVIEDIKIQEYLYGTLNDIPSPWLLKDIKKTVDIIEKLIALKKKIRIIGDYDIDGVTATFILLQGLRRIGADVDIYIPDRILDGYGIHMNLVEKAVADHVECILTCDNGIAAFSEIKYAKEKGLTVLVTDHHEIPFEDSDDGKKYILPPADAIINPKQEDCLYPNKNICGAVVAWKLISALYERYDIAESEKNDFIEFAALATVGDVMTLQGENRIIVKEGLKRIKDTKNIGLSELIRANQLEESKITAYHVGFILGPCINASGRLDTAVRSLALFLAKTKDEAAKLAGDLKAINESRKQLTNIGKDQAIQLIESTDLKNDRVLVVFLPECHESLAGIIAGRIREKYNKPSIVLTKGEKLIKGSGRSIEGYSMFEELVKCSHLLEKFGGHPMAAGLSLKEENIDRFREEINRKCELTNEQLVHKILIDVAMPISYISKKLIRQISILEPFGNGNVKPIFAQKDLRVLSKRIFGKNKNVIKLQLMSSDSCVMDAVYFGETESFWTFLENHEMISITYYPDINVFQGRETIQIIIQNFR